MPGPLRTGLALAVLAGMHARIAGAEPPALDRVRIRYSAPVGCPDEAAFLAQVASRIGRAWQADPDELAHTIEVSVTTAKERSSARMELVGEGGRRTTRALTAASCDEVVSGIALVTVLAIEARLPDPEDAVETGTDAPSAAPPPATPRLAERAPVPAGRRAHAPSPARAPITGASARPAASARRFHYDFGGAARATSGVGPGLALGPRVYAGVGVDRGVSFRLAMDAVDTGLTDAGGGVVRFSLLAGSATVCPLAMSLASWLRVVPCAGIELGRTAAEALAVPPRPRTANQAEPPWVAPTASLGFEAKAEVVIFVVSLDASFPLGHREFVFEDPRAVVYDRPAVAVGGSAGVGIRL
jgi:hypothetical protein